MTLKAIWAQARDHAGRPVIGRDGDMPWHLPEDLAHFQRLTRGHAVIMGRRTWESLPARFRPLPGRVNIVVTSLTALDGAYVAGSIAGALELASRLEEMGDLTDGAVRWVIGGERLYAEAVGLAESIEVTEIDLVTEGDAFAPVLDPTRWLVAGVSEPAASEEGLDFRFVTYVRA